MIWELFKQQAHVEECLEITLHRASTVSHYYSSQHMFLFNNDKSFKPVNSV
jgi:hypothetical protein